MKLHSLELEGFGPYRDRQRVDFDAFADDGIFLIAGRTGAGKSSILDGVCFALYGGVPRYDGTEKRLRSDHCEPEDATEVVLEFTVAGARWRATRAPEYERPKRRGGGVTTEGARALLDEFVDERWEGRASGPRDVALALDEILGLTQQQFLQVILLAQNRFQRFLLARNDERQALLRTLFGTRTYEQYEKELEQRRKDAEAAVAAGAQRIAVHLADAEDVIGEHELGGDDEPGTSTDERIAHAERAGQRAAYRAETAAAERDAAEHAHRAVAAAHAAALALHIRLEQRERSRIALDALIANGPAIAADRETLERAARAEGLRAPVEAVERAALAAATATEAEAGARAAWVAAGEDPLDADALTARIEQIGAELGVAGAAVAREGDLARQEAAAASSADRIEQLERSRAGLDDQCAGIPAELDRIDEAHTEATVAAAALDAAREARDRMAAQLTAARDAETLATEVHDAEKLHAARSGELGRAVAAVTALLQRRLAGYAGELAASLVDGEACAVCGSTEHPQPAAHGADPVTDAAVTAAEWARDAATDAEREASVAARAVRAAHGEATARSGGGSAARLEKALAVAEAAVAAAEKSGARRDRLAAQRDELIALQTAAGAERESLGVSIAQAAQTLAVANAHAERLRADIASARGSYPSVTERVEDLVRRRRLASALLTAIGDREARVEAEREVRADCAARVAASAFADVGAATAALRDEKTRAGLDTRVRAHESALHAERERLREWELELAGADDRIDVAASAIAVDGARRRWDAAVAAAASATHAAARLTRSVARAAATRADIAGLVDEHAAVTRLANTVAGRAPNTHRMTLEAFVLAAELEEIVDAAGRRLHEMSSGRYRLQHTDARAARNASSGLGIEVFDAYTGQARPAQSLSGGETFLASLALALGLAEVVTGRAGGLRLDTLFIDEGFGSLDAETLDLAMTTLDELRQGGRTVGVISHVEAMREQLPAQLVVEATSNGSSAIRQGVAALI